MVYSLGAPGTRPSPTPLSRLLLLRHLPLLSLLLLGTATCGESTAVAPWSKNDAGWDVQYTLTGSAPDCPIAAGFGTCGGGVDCGYQWGTLVSVYPYAPPSAYAASNCCFVPNVASLA